jgi:hypothetical protein
MRSNLMASRIRTTLSPWAGDGASDMRCQRGIGGRCTRDARIGPAPYDNPIKKRWLVKLAANISFLFTELEPLERIAAAKRVVISFGEKSRYGDRRGHDHIVAGAGHWSRGMTDWYRTRAE